MFFHDFPFHNPTFAFFLFILLKNEISDKKEEAKTVFASPLLSFYPKESFENHPSPLSTG